MLTAIPLIVAVILALYAFAAAILPDGVAARFMEGVINIALRAWIVIAVVAGAFVLYHIMMVGSR